MKLKYKRTVAIFVCLALFGMVTTVSAPVKAYSLNGYHWDSYTITYYFDSTCSTRAISCLNYAVQQWNDRLNSVRLSTGTSSRHNICCSEVDEPNVVWDGSVYYETNGEYFLNISLRLNSGIYRTWNDTNALKSVAVHEFGHAYGLADRTGMAIINGKTWGSGSRYETYGYTTPRTDDIEGVNSIYYNL